MKTPTKILICLLVLGIFIAGCTYQPESSDEGEQISYIGDNISVAADNGGVDALSNDTGNGVEVINNDESSAMDTAEEPEHTPPVQESAAKSPGEITVYEGELVQLKVKGSDPDGDPIEYTFSAPLDDEGKWQTGIGDAGDYLVTVTASDGKIKSTRTLKINVIAKNSKPVIEDIADVTVREGETVSFSPKVSDADGDDVTVKYSGWMTKSSKTTGFDDAGVHSVTITASDGKEEVSKNVKVTVLDVNRAPEFEIIVS